MFMAQLAATALVFCIVVFGVGAYLDNDRSPFQKMSGTVMLLGCIGLYGGALSFLLLIVALIWGL